jgi:hypothetical protein
MIRPRTRSPEACATNSLKMSGSPSGHGFRPSRTVYRVWIRGVFSTASSGYCIRAHRGAILRGASVHTHRRSLAKGRNLRQDHGCADHRSHCRRADNRNVHCLGASARGLYCRQQSGRRRIGVQTMIGSEQASVFGDRKSLEIGGSINSTKIAVAKRGLLPAPTPVNM